jgi:hypothetical protein
MIECLSYDLCNLIERLMQFYKANKIDNGRLRSSDPA